MTMNAARLDKSKRLQRVFLLLQDRAWHTTRDIIENAYVCAVNSCIAELRANGLGVDCERRGVGVYRYRLASGGDTP